MMLALLLTATLLAQDEDCGTCAKLQGVPAVPESIEQVSKAIDNFTVGGDKEVAAAFCRAPLPDDLSMAEWMEERETEKKFSKEINGVSFENESKENLRTFELLTTAVDSLGRLDLARQKKFQSRCNKVDCALKEIFGETAVSMKYMQQRYGFNTSHLAYANSSSWKKSELRELIQAVKDFPEGVLPQDESRPFTRFSKGYIPANYDEYTLADSTIRFFDRWEKTSPGTRQSTVTHEIAHYIAQKTRADDSAHWLKCSDWTTKQVMENGKPAEQWQLGKPETVVSKYGKTDPGEDFAEAVTAYRFSPNELKAMAPDKYEYIKNTIFDGVEYTTEEKCRNPQRNSERLKEKISQQLTQLNPSPNEITRLSGGCLSAMYDRLAEVDRLDLKTDPYVQNCLGSATPQLVQEMAVKQLAQDTTGKYQAPMFRNIKVELPPALKQKLQTQAPTRLRDHFISSSTSALWVVLSKVKPFTEANCRNHAFEDAPNYMHQASAISPGLHWEKGNEIRSFARRFCLGIAAKRKGDTSEVEYNEVERHLRFALP